MKRAFFVIFLLLLPFVFGNSGERTYSEQQNTQGSPNAFKIVRLKYSGGGDWYNDPSEEVNMMDYLKKNTVIDVDEPKFISVDVSSIIPFYILQATEIFHSAILRQKGSGLIWNAGDFYMPMMITEWMQLSGER